MNPAVSAFIDLGRTFVNDATAATRREWLVTNGIGGFAAGTLAQVPTRRYHGLLVAALRPPLGRTVLLSKIDEIVRYNKNTYELGAARWRSTGDRHWPQGYLHLERFHLEGTIPVWTFALGEARLEKRVWMRQGENTTYINYRLRHAAQTLKLDLQALVSYRDFHNLSHGEDWQMGVESVDNGLRVQAFDGARPFYLLSKEAASVAQHQWYFDYVLQREVERGLDFETDNLYAAHFALRLKAGEACTIVASTEPTPLLDGAAVYQERLAYEAALLARSQLADQPDWIQQLGLAADQFIVQRPLAEGDESGRSVIAGYHWFGDWGRDTMIALPGLTLTTGRAVEAKQILRTFAKFVDQGMLPNRFPDDGEEPEYNTVDATLWYFEAIQQVWQATQDKNLLADLFPILQEIVEWHQKGTRYGIHVDGQDGLLYAGEEGSQLTWMDAKVGSWVVTPRRGKPVEINALWYNGLRLMADFAAVLGHPAVSYQEMAQRVQESFQRFWHEDKRYCYDVLDTPEGDDGVLRPNQLLAVSLTYSPLTAAQQEAVVAICERELVTAVGLRSLAADDPAYIGQYGGPPLERDGAYHQGQVWSWLIGPFVAAHLRVHQNPAEARRFLEPFRHHLLDGCLGTITEIATGDVPHWPRGAVAQAWGVAELLRTWVLVTAADVGHGLK